MKYCLLSNFNLHSRDQRLNIRQETQTDTALHFKLLNMQQKRKGPLLCIVPVLADPGWQTFLHASISNCENKLAHTRSDRKPFTPQTDVSMCKNDTCKGKRMLRTPKKNNQHRQGRFSPAAQASHHLASLSRKSHSAQLRDDSTNFWFVAKSRETS